MSGAWAKIDETCEVIFQKLLIPSIDDRRKFGCQTVKESFQPSFNKCKIPPIIMKSCKDLYPWGCIRRRGKVGFVLVVNAKSAIIAHILYCTLLENVVPNLVKMLGAFITTDVFLQRYTVHQGTFSYVNLSYCCLDQTQSQLRALSRVQNTTFYNHM